MTWRDLITRALNRLEVYGAATPVTPEDEDLAVDLLNDWIDGLKLDGLSMFQRVRTTWALTAAASFTVGIGGTINVARPARREHIAGFAYQNNNATPPYEYGVGPPLTPSQYESIPVKTLTNTYPLGFYYEPTFTAAGLGTVYPFPVITGANLLGVMYSGVPIDEIVLVTDTILLPPGYRLMLRTAAEVVLAPAFRRPVDADMRRQMVDARAAVLASNEVLEDIGFGEAGALFGPGNNGINIYTGDV